MLNVNILFNNFIRSTISVFPSGQKKILFKSFKNQWIDTVLANAIKKKFKKKSFRKLQERYCNL